MVEAVGDQVGNVATGDQVVLTFLDCDACIACHQAHPACCENVNPYNVSAQRIDGTHALTAADASDLNDRFFGQSLFEEYAVANARNVVKVRADAPIELVVLMGCGIQTGAGTVMNALAVTPGSGCVDWACGPVGNHGGRGGRGGRGTTIISVDIVQSRLDLA